MHLRSMDSPRRRSLGERARAFGRFWVELFTHPAFLILVTAFLFVFFVLAIPGCGEATAKYKGQELTGAQIEAAQSRELAAIAKQQELDAAKAKADIAAAQAKAEAEKARIQREYAAELKKLGTTSALEAAKLNAASESARTDLDLAFADRGDKSIENLAHAVAKISGDYDQRSAQRDDAVAGEKAIAEAAFTKIDAINAQRAQTWGVLSAVTQVPVIKQATDAFGLSDILKGVIGIGGASAVGWAARARGSKERHDASWQDGHDFAVAQASEKDKTWDNAIKETKPDALQGVIAALAPVLLAKVVDNLAAPKTPAAASPGI